jgi:hypothetical protein
MLGAADAAEVRHYARVLREAVGLLGIGYCDCCWGASLRAEARRYAGVLREAVGSLNIGYA